MLDKERIKKAVLKGISEMPSTALIYRKLSDEYGQPSDDPPVLICTLTGLFYKSSSSINISLSTNNEQISKPDTRFLIDYNDKSVLVKSKDVLELTSGMQYTILDPGMNFEIYFDMVVKEIG